MDWQYSGQIKAWMGLSTIVKPTNIERDSKAFEYDTKKTFIFNGTTWIDDIPLPSSLIPIITPAVTLYNAITATPVSATEIVLGNTDSVKIEISGTASARTITFAAKFTSTSTAITIDGYNWSTHTLATSTTGTSSELWEFDGLTGFYSLVITPTVITGGNLTIKVVEVT
jgi:hypothetical protein